ncbi:MAG: flagellar basal body M-ring protein FliF [Rhodocyclaceae bacterium]|nr:flagellar basal body M-ring protein FliF [Rhodocyclaceae bacterium]
MADAASTALPFNLSLEAINRLSARQKMAAAAATALAIAILSAAWMWAKAPVYGVLFSNLEEKDGGQIIATLQQQNIPYKLSDSGSAIMVPSAQVHDIRLRLASQGLPRGGFVGFEVMESMKLGASQFQEQINYQRALEGELARTISTISSVRGARVHLAIPKQTAFLRDEMKPSASVLVNLLGGRTLEPTQVAGIVHLVSSSVPQLNAANVSVIDQDGTLISRQPDSQRAEALDPSQLKYVREVEQTTIRRIEEILATVVGKTNIKAQVSADVDFSQSELVAETYKPNPSPETAIRSQQTAETGTASPEAIGVPGALTNQPPVPAVAPLTNPAVPGAAQATANSTKQPVNYSRNATTNYELDKTVKHTKGGPGTIRRLSVAVVVNHKASIDAKTGKPKAVPYSDAEMKQINDLVREAMGYNKDRGDTVSIANAPFTSEPEATTPILDRVQPYSGNILEFVKYLAFAVIAWLLWTRLLQPLFARIAETMAAQARDQQALAMATAHGAGHHEASPQVQAYEEKLEAARDLVRQDPKVVANVIKEWVGAGEPR